ncbi:MAG TPA: DUF3352 domain-containing protein [Acidimicrobiales bacterium]|nr:DUF3352 domain-containing protein [Acidimicrobiales bacterium]
MRRFLAAALGATLLVLPACGNKTDETARAAGITPASALAMFSVNLSPSIEQKRNMLSIARRFPDASDKVKGEFESARDDLLASLFEDTGLDYKKDIEPWLGKEAAAAVLPPGDADAPLIVAMVQTEDEAKAKAAIAKATKAGDFEGAYAIVDDYVVISAQDDPADNQPALDQIVAQGKKDEGSLADTPSFTKVVGELHGDRLVLGWFDSQKALDLAGDVGALAGADFLKQFGAGAIAFDLHAESKAVVLQGVAAVASNGSSGSEPALTRALPASTLAALTLFDIAGSATKGLESLGGVGGGDIVGDLEQATGIDLGDDVLSWMGGEAVVVVGAVPEGQEFPAFALVVEPTDKAKAAAGIDKVRQQLAANQFRLDERTVAGATAYVLPQPVRDGIQPAMALFPDRFVLASSPAYLEELGKASTPSLGSNDTYTDVVGDDGKGTMAQFVVLIDPVREAIENVVLNAGADRESYEKDTKPNLEPLSAFGVKVHRDGGFNRFEVKLTLD